MKFAHFRDRLRTHVSEEILIRSGLWLSVDSSLVRWMRYDLHDRILEVEFKNGKQYRYGSVPVPVFREMLEAESKGHFYSTRIKGKYPSMRLNFSDEERAQRNAEMRQANQLLTAAARTSVERHANDRHDTARVMVG